ncbi:MAG: hypothetical protein NZM35_05675 [Chitinophagales bacterium]|nr:hypothetical protein [Chitinophagales bacterium]MDW8419084.1 hypothetical protein [Chitinophagales bacterium]
MKIYCRGGVSLLSARLRRALSSKIRRQAVLCYIARWRLSAPAGEGCEGRDHRERCVTQWSTGAKRTP